MQANTITLSVDWLNNSSPSNEVLTRHNETLNRSDYIRPDHTIAVRELVQLYRTFPKRNGESNGVAKMAVKLTQDVSVDNVSGTGEIIMPLIGEVSFAIPVGTDAATVLGHRMLTIAALQHADLFAKLMATLEI